MNRLQTETRGRFRWLRTVECDADLTIRVVRAELPGGLLVERVDGPDDLPLVFITDLAGCEVTLTLEEAAELRAALAELPDP